jgi:uncharacterized protein YbaP (TraB family)
MNFLQKTRTSWLALVLTLALPVLPAYGAAGTSVEAEAAASTPSVWAMEDVAYTKLHQLAAEQLFADYQAPATVGELNTAGLSLQHKLAERTASATEAVYGQAQAPAAELSGADATRQDAAVVLYAAIRESLPQVKPVTGKTTLYPELDALAGNIAEAVRYIADHGILKGKQDGSLNLADTLTREQLLSLTYRTYEFVLQESNTASKGLVWKVSGGKSPVYVLGSIHIGDISIYPLDNLIKDAYEGSSYLAVEADVTQDPEGIQYMSEKAVFSDGTTLDKHVSAETYKLFAQQMEKAGLTEDVYKTLKPWYAALLLQNLSLSEASYSANLGLDIYFLSEAAKTQKSVLQVEGIKFQVDMFDSFDPKLQEEFLLETLKASEGQTDGQAGAESGAEAANAQTQMMQSLLHYWSTGDAEDFGKLIARSNEAEAGASEFNRIFWDERNKNMFHAVEKYLGDTAGHSYFVVVGAGHLFGDTGVLKELQKAGYTTEQLLD